MTCRNSTDPVKTIGISRPIGQLQQLPVYGLQGRRQRQSFKEIWNNDNYKQFRSELMKSRKNIDICANCSEGLTVWED